MRVMRIRTDRREYCCNVYLVLGDGNGPEDVNTLVDVGSVATAGEVMRKIEEASTGIGKKPVEQVVLTHCHFDHAGALQVIRDRFDPVVWAYAAGPGVDRHARNGKRLRLGDSVFEVIHTPGHSPDSICLYCEEDRTLFSGDAPVNIRTPGGSYSKEAAKSLDRLSRLNVRTIYSGHNDPMTKGAVSMIGASLKNVLASQEAAGA